jgi:hypothetical protein
MSKEVRRRPIRKWLAASLIIVLLYIAASGPLYRAAASGSGTFWKCIDGIYQPLLQAAAATEFEQPLLKYLRSWGVRTRQTTVELSPQKRVIHIGVLPPPSLASPPTKLPPSTPPPTPESKPPATPPQ